MSIFLLMWLRFLPCFLHSAVSCGPHMLQRNFFFVFLSQSSHTENIVSFSHFSHKYIGKSAVMPPCSNAAWTHLSLPPSLPTGKSMCGLPFSFLIFAFSGLPILEPMNVPDLSRSFTEEILLIVFNV